jgi:hypothetical protein
VREDPPGKGGSGVCRVAEGPPFCAVAGVDTAGATSFKPPYQAKQPGPAQRQRKAAVLDPHPKGCRFMPEQQQGMAHIPAHLPNPASLAG